MIKKMRAFLAIELVDAVKAELADFIEHIKRKRIEGLRTVDLKGVYVTLKFLRDIVSTEIDPVVEIVSRAANTLVPFTLAIRRCGVFYNRLGPRVL